MQAATRALKIVSPCNTICCCSNPCNNDSLERSPSIRHGPFDIQGGGAWNFGPGREFFFQTKSERDYFFRRPFGPDYFFHNQKLHLWHIGFRDIYLCLIQAFATTSCLMHPFTTTSYSNLRLSRQIYTRSNRFSQQLQ